MRQYISQPSPLQLVIAYSCINYFGTVFGHANFTPLRSSLPHSSLPLLVACGRVSLGITLTLPSGMTPGPVLPLQLVGGHVVLQDDVGAAFGHAIDAHHVLRLGRPHHHAVHPRHSRHHRGGAAFVHDAVITPLRPVPQFAPYATCTTMPCPTLRGRAFYTTVSLLHLYH